MKKNLHASRVFRCDMEPAAKKTKRLGRSEMKTLNLLAVVLPVLFSVTGTPPCTLAASDDGGRKGAGLGGMRRRGARCDAGRPSQGRPRRRCCSTVVIAGALVLRHHFFFFFLFFFFLFCFSTSANRLLSHCIGLLVPRPHFIWFSGLAPTRSWCLPPQ